MIDAAGQPVSPDVPYNIRFYRPGDEEGILAVLQASFPRWPAIEIEVPAIDHLRWKLAGTPDPETTHVVALADSRIVGCHLSLVRTYRNEGLVAVRTDVDVAVAPEWRGRGVNPATTKLSVDTSPAPFVLTSTDNESIRRADYHRGHRPIRNRLIATSCDLTRKALPLDGMHIIQTTSFDNRIESFWTEAVAPYEFTASPSAPWLNWRYCDPRGGNGFVLQAEQRDQIVGFVAARMSWNKGYVAYLLALPARNNVVRSLLAACIDRFVEAGLTEAACALPEHHPYRPVLTELGFVRNRRRIPLSARPGGPADPERPFRDNPQARVHIMFGDLDLV
jgi:GNAT superfamily N-acetyltransferase